MSNVFQRIKNRVKTNVANSKLFLNHSLAKSKSIRKTDTAGRIVYVELSNPRLERYLYLLLKFFEAADCRICLKFNPWLLLNLRNFSDWIYTLENFEIVLSPPKNYDLLLTDKENRGTDGKTLFVDVNYFTRQKSSGAYFFPYNMHPEIYRFRLAENLAEFRRQPKKIKVFFGGNTGIGYGNSDISRLFGKITRNDLVAYLEKYASAEFLFSSADETDLQRLLSGEKFDLVSVKKPLFSLENWMKMLAQSDFYIAAPGFSMPFSHNVVEAMAVGAIPILQYPEMFDPPLEHLENCLQFSSEADLLEKVETASKMDERKLEAMREEVLNYYENYLEPTRAVANLFDKLSSLNRLYINSEHISVKELRKELAKTETQK